VSAEERPDGPTDDEVTLLRRRDGDAAATGSDSWAGSTMIARRESRRRSSRATDAATAADPHDDAPAGIRTAAVPVPVPDAAAYPARDADAVIVPRRPANVRANAGTAEVPQAPGQAARRLAARRLTVVLGGGAAMVVVGGVLLAVLLTVR
jgi:hypothetical protein